MMRKFYLLLLLLMLNFKYASAEYFGDCIILKVTVYMKNNTIIHGWLEPFCFDNPTSKYLFVQDLTSKRENCAKNVFSKRNQTDKIFYINQDAVATYYGYIFSSDGSLQINKDSVKSLDVNQIDSVKMGCLFITKIPGKEIYKYQQTSVKKTDIIFGGSGTYTFLFFDFTIQNGQMVLEAEQHLLTDWANIPDDTLNKLLKLGVIVKLCIDN